MIESRELFGQSCLPNESAGVALDFWKELTDVVDRVVAPEAGAADRGSDPPRRSLAALAEIGALGVQVPPAFGGLGLGDPMACLVVERVARACASTAAVLMFHFQVVRRTLVHGPDLHRDDDLRGFAAGTLLGSSAWTEASSGADKSRIATAARADGRELSLTGEKTFCTGLTSAGVIHVLCDLQRSSSGGPTFLRVPTKDPGVTISEPYPLLGLRASGTATVSFDGVALTGDDVVGSAGAGPALMRENHEVCLNPGLIALGVASSALDSALSHLRDGTRTPAPLENDHVRLETAQGAVALDAAYALAAGAVVEPPSGRARARSAAFKLHATSMSEDVTSRLLHAVGSRGFVATSPLERAVRDARATALMGPSNALLAQRVVDDLTPPIETQEARVA